MGTAEWIALYNLCMANGVTVEEVQAAIQAVINAKKEAGKC